MQAHKSSFIFSLALSLQISNPLLLDLLFLILLVLLMQTIVFECSFFKTLQPRFG